MRSIPVLLLLVGLSSAWAASEGAKSPSVAQWAEKLSAATGDEEREIALSALKALASGLTGSAENREAAFALAAYRAGRPGESGRQAHEALIAATSMYPDDDRTPALLIRLAELQLEAADPFAAHATFRRIVEEGHADDNPGLLARAAHNAAEARDVEAALAWSLLTEPAELEASDRALLQIARLRSAQPSGRSKMALEAARDLTEQAPSTLNVDAEALLAAARVHQSVGLLEDAVANYFTFVNVHPGHDDHAEAMLELGRLEQRIGRHAHAGRTFEWLRETHALSAEAFESRFDSIGLDGSEADASKIPEYINAFRSAPGVREGADSCLRFVDKFIGAGLPLEAAGAVLHLAIDVDDDGLGPLVASQCLHDSMTTIVGLLEAREDVVAIAGIATELEAHGLPSPPPLRARFGAARHELGLRGGSHGALEQAIDEARALAASGQWELAADRLEQAIIVEVYPDPHSAVESRRILAQALWWSGRGEEAIARAREALELTPTPRQRRALKVMLADALFDVGETEEACSAYRAAGSEGRSEWVDLQIRYCETPTAGRPEESGKEPSS